jgi:hypothetical protein
MLAARVEQKIEHDGKQGGPGSHFTGSERFDRATACADLTSGAARVSWPRRNKRSMAWMMAVLCRLGLRRNDCLANPSAHARRRQVVFTGSLQ